MKLKNSSSQSIVTNKNIKYHVMKQSLSLTFHISILELWENQHKSENHQIVSTKTIASGYPSHGNQCYPNYSRNNYNIFWEMPLSSRYIYVAPAVYILDFSGISCASYIRPDPVSALPLRMLHHGMDKTSGTYTINNVNSSLTRSTAETSAYSSIQLLTEPREV